MELWLELHAVKSRINEQNILFTQPFLLQKGFTESAIETKANSLVILALKRLGWQKPGGPGAIPFLEEKT